MQTKIIIISLVSLLFFQFNLSGKIKTTLNQRVVFSMEELSDSSLHDGLAGSFFGKQGKWFILAGGYSFRDGKPWENGKKYYSDMVMVFQQQPDGTFTPVYQGNDLPVPLAEGSYISLPEGLLCVGGQTPDGLSNKSYLLSYNDLTISISEYPDLPIAVKGTSATQVGSTIYLVGGEMVDGGFTNQFLSLDISMRNKSWKRLTNYPVPVSGTTIVSQQDGEQIALFAFGGQTKTNTGLTTIYSSVYHYNPSTGLWTQKKDIQLKNKQAMPLVAATASTVGGTHIMLYGGITGLVFNQAKIAISAEKIEKRDSLWKNHTGYNNKILVYNTITDTWYKAGETNNPPVAVTSEVSDGRNIYIASGEIGQGVNSPLIRQLYYNSQPSFGWLNYTIILAYFGGMLLLGFYFMKRNDSTDDFFKASGRIPWWAAGISIFATTLSAITFLSIPAKSYALDWRMLVFNLTILLIVPIVIRYFLPFFRRFNFGTAYEYLEVRFNRSVRWLASTLFVLFMISRIAIVLFLPSLALNAVTGFDIYLSIIVMGIVTIIYSTSGGMEAVVWGDVIQGFILVFGAISAFIIMIIGIDGGFSEFWNTSLEYQKFNTFDFKFDFSQPVFWVVLMGGVANSLITYTSDQSVIQRYMTTKDEKATSRSIWLNGILSIPVSILFFLLGTGLFAFYKANPENMMITNPNIDSVFPQFIVSEMPIGFAGLLIAAVFAAAMSTLSSNINSSSAVITSDFYKTIFRKRTSKSEMQVARWSGILCGLLGIGMALVLATWNIASLWDQFNTFLGLLTSGLGALFILGIFFPRVGAHAALIGIVFGLAMLILLKNNTSLSFLLYGLIGMMSSLIISFLISLIFPNKKNIIGFTWKTISKKI